MSRVSHAVERLRVTFDEPNLVANAGLLLVATLAARLELETVVNRLVSLGGRVGGAKPGRKVMTIVHAIVAGASHIDHVDVLRCGGTAKVLPFRVMAPSTVGSFLRSFTFGHVRQLEAVVAETLRRAWAMGAGPGAARLVVDVDSTICEVEGAAKQGAAYGYTKVLGYHPSWPPGPTPARCCTPACARARPTPPEEPGASSTSWWPGCAGPGRAARS